MMRMPCDLQNAYHRAVEFIILAKLVIIFLMIFGVSLKSGGNLYVKGNF